MRIYPKKSKENKVAKDLLKQMLVQRKPATNNEEKQENAEVKHTVWKTHAFARNMNGHVAKNATIHKEEWKQTNKGKVEGKWHMSIRYTTIQVALLEKMEALHKTYGMTLSICQQVARETLRNTHV